MTRKHFVTLAHIISGIQDWKSKIHTFKGVLALCGETNPNFNPITFADACGLSSYYNGMIAGAKKK